MAKFKQGKSGNPSGRPKGIKDRRHHLRDQLEAAAPDLIAAVIRKALEGDTQAMRLCLDRIVPALRPSPLPVSFPLQGETLTDKANALLDAVSKGDVPSDQAAALIAALGTMTRILESDEFNRRLSKLEAKEGEPVDPEFL